MNGGLELAVVYRPEHVLQLVYCILPIPGILEVSWVKKKGLKGQ